MQQFILINTIGIKKFFEHLSFKHNKKHVHLSIKCLYSLFQTAINIRCKHLNVSSHLKALQLDVNKITKNTVKDKSCRFDHFIEV